MAPRSSRVRPDPRSTGCPAGGTDGNLAVSVGIAAVGLIIVLTLIKWPISVRVYTVLLVLLATVVAIVLYNPSIVA